ncbi:DUF4232 domain-containing protein [Streptomyces sp. NPDC050803]|uniref:DUF4232 domain-containing protein n=1 Tax=unclassified Streptomyces TaxID=2593676 RepID=UPI003428EE1A
MSALARKDRKNRTNRRGRQFYVLGAAAAAALLATTACESDTADEGKSSDRPSATSSATSAETAPTEPDDSGSTGEEGGDDSSTTPLCTMEDLSVSATDYDGTGENVRHVLLVVTNAGDKKCDVQGAPEVTLGDAQGPAPVLEGTDSAEAVTLAPGAEAYAGLLVSGGGMDTYEATRMTLGLGSPGGESEPDEPVDVPMPVDVLSADDGQRVTAWAGTEGLAMRPVTQS